MTQEIGRSLGHRDKEVEWCPQFEAKPAHEPAAGAQELAVADPLGQQSIDSPHGRRRNRSPSHNLLQHLPKTGSEHARLNESPGA